MNTCAIDCGGTPAPAKTTTTTTTSSSHSGGGGGGGGGSSHHSCGWSLSCYAKKAYHVVERHPVIAAVVATAVVVGAVACVAATAGACGAVLVAGAEGFTAGAEIGGLGAAVTGAAAGVIGEGGAVIAGAAGIAGAGAPAVSKGAKTAATSEAAHETGAASASADAAEMSAAPPADSCTPGGGAIRHTHTSTSLGSDSATMSVREHAKNAGHHDVIVHGSTRGVLGVDGQDTNPLQIVEAVRGNPHYEGGSFEV